MRKTLLVSAIAAATFSGAAAAQPTMSASEMAAKMDSMPTVYGNIQYALTYNDVENEAGQKFDGIDHFDNGTTLGVKHEHEIAPGITGFLKMELEGIGADDKAGSNGIDSLDEAYIGVKGDNFGQIWVGSDDSMYESAIDEIVNFHEVGSDIGGNYDTGEGDLIQYLSPSFGGLQLGAAVQVNGDAKEGGKSYPYQLAAIYTVDALELAFAMDSNDGNLAYSKDGLDGNAPDAGELSDNNENTYGLRASYNLEDLRLTASYETRKDVADVFGVMGVYTLGANQFALSYQLNDNDDEAGDQNDTIAIQALHNLSSNMYVYVEGYVSSADADTKYNVGGLKATGDERSTLALGATYYF